MRKIFVLAVFSVGCATVHNVTIRPDYETADKTQTVRLAVFTSPIPEGGERVAQLWSEIASKYVSDHRDFIVRTQLGGAAEPANLCGDGIEGILHLVPHLKRVGTGVEAAVDARLTRCRDGELVWSASAGGAWESDDPHLTEATQHYVDKYGQDVKPYVAPSFLLLRATLETLPVPKLPDDAAVMEKIELAD